MKASQLEIPVLITLLIVAAIIASVAGYRRVISIRQAQKKKRKYSQLAVQDEENESVDHDEEMVVYPPNIRELGVPVCLYLEKQPTGSSFDRYENLKMSDYAYQCE